MCRLFPTELIDTIAGGKSPAGRAIDVVTRHIFNDLADVGSTLGISKPDMTGFSDTFAWCALMGSAKRRFPARLVGT